MRIDAGSSPAGHFIMFVAEGKLTYYSDYCVAYVDPEISKYYRSLLPKALYVQSTQFPPHTTVVRKTLEVARDHKEWGKYSGVEVPVYYIPVVHTDNLYYWLNAYSPVLNAIRKELGLHPYRFPFNCFHITIGNRKNA